MKMKIYVINTISKLTWVHKISQEGYTTKESAVAFIKSRVDRPKNITETVFESDVYIYEIVDITIV